MSFENPPIREFPPTPEKDPEFERRKKEISRLIKQNGQVTEQQLKDWLEDTPAKEIKRAIKELENEGEIERKTAPDGTKYYIIVE